MLAHTYKFYEEELGVYNFYSSLKKKRDLNPELYNRLILIPDEIGYPISEIKNKEVYKDNEVYVQPSSICIFLCIF